MAHWKAQHFALHGYGLRGNQGCTILGKISSKHSSYVEQRAAAANQALIMGAVTDNVAFGTQHGVLQGHCI
jgi:hypothetical protein